MTISLDAVTVRDKKVLGYLIAYLERMSHYDHFQNDMLLQVFVNDEKDFTAFEAKDFRLQFTSSAHKLNETIKSKTSLEAVAYNDFLRHLKKIQRESA